MEKTEGYKDFEKQQIAYRNLEHVDFDEKRYSYRDMLNMQERWRFEETLWAMAAMGILVLGIILGNLHH